MTGVPALVVALVLPAVAGWLLVELLDFRDDRSVLATAGRVATGVVAGLGVSSVVAFGYLLVGGALDDRYVAIDAAVFALSSVGAFLAYRQRRLGDRSPRTHGATARLDVLAGFLVLLSIVVAICAFVRMSQAAPHGYWDAWAIWNQRARFVLRGGTEWRRAFAPELAWSHTEYPLMVPLAVARLWAYMGETVLVPAIVAGVFTFSVPVVLAAAVARRAGNVTGAAAALVLLGTREFTLAGAIQYADVPLAALLVAALAALDRESVGGHPAKRRLALAGLLLGLGGWTKNEGLAAAAWALVAYVFVGWRTRGRATARDLLSIAAGAALPALAWVVFHAAVTPSVEVELGGQGVGQVAAKLVDAARWRAVLVNLWSSFPGSSGSLVGIAVAIALGARVRPLARSVPFLTSVLMICSIAVVFAITPQQLAWHIENASTRLLFQTWPALLLGLFTAAVPRREQSSGAMPAGGTGLDDAAP